MAAANISVAAALDLNVVLRSVVHEASCTSTRCVGGQQQADRQTCAPGSTKHLVIHVMLSLAALLFCGYPLLLCLKVQVKRCVGPVVYWLFNA